ncbi:hypothetical protein F6X40_09405 [Paraburkholderia sp. UCT31]|uniref:hypothetical protein n=1 Tax=Paraburkholderia sp. UCT31 TaxID=2615209 RepID=UPI00165568C7|nr:hypothetical protein [Paraburkholderia sp. UCT31]MBC8737024.1 hypothetical protein [Paraburkholderia sp. UCT31]
MTIRIPTLKAQANILSDALKTELGAPDAQRTKVLDVVAQMNGIHTWRHAVALGKAEDEGIPPETYLPLPAWVFELAAVQCGWFDELSVKDRVEIYSAIANAGFSPLQRGQALTEFRRRIGPNGVQAFIPEMYDEDPHYPESRHAFCSTTFGVVDDNNWDVDVQFGASWKVALAKGLAEAEKQRVSCLDFPDTWEHDLSWRLRERGIDWETQDWRAEMAKLKK